MNILITGGAGFIGSNIVEYLCKEKLYTYKGRLQSIHTLYKKLKDNEKKYL